jgi:nucleotide-binding universal stress UspA family protein
MDDVKRILVVSRMTTYCRKAVHYGISLAKKYSAELYFIHCTHNPFVFEWPLSVPVWVLAEDYKKLLFKNKEDIDTIINLEKEKGLKIKELIKVEDPVEVILEAVKEEKIDLIIMAAHEEGRLEHFLFGHCNDEIVRKMPCSVLLVKTEQGSA